MEFSVRDWFSILMLSSLLSAVIAYPTVALFVTRPIQRKLRQTKEDFLSDWIVWPFQSGFYAMGVVVPFARWRHERNRSMVDAYELIRQAASPVQRWLSYWLLVSMLLTPLLIFSLKALDYFMVW